MVRLCEKENETYAVTNINIRDLMMIEGRRLIGIAGQAIDNLFTRLDKRRCELIGEPSLGQESANGSWSGNLGLLQRKQAIMYMKTEAPIVQPSWLKLSMPVLTEAFVIIQDIGLQKSEDFNLMQNLNFGIQVTSLFLSMSFFSLIFIFFLISMRKFLANNVTGTKCSLKKVVSSYLKINKKFSFALSSMSIFIVMFHLYLWLFTVLITNSTQTNKVVIDTSQIIQNVGDALNTERIFCLIEDDTEYKIATLSSKDNAIRKVFDRKSMLKKPINGVNEKYERCLIEKSEKSAGIDTQRVFTIIAEQSAYVAAAFISSVKSNLLGWFSDPVYLQNLHIYHIIEDDGYVKNLLYSYTESGLFVCLLRTLRKNALFLFTKENHVYFSIKEFTEDMTKFDNLSFGNFRMVFAIFFSFCLILLVVYMANNILAKAYGLWLKRIRRRKRKKRRRTIFKFQKDPDILSDYRNALEMKWSRLASLAGDNYHSRSNSHYRS